jgi:hypothetical protein
MTIWRSYIDGLQVINTSARGFDTPIPEQLGLESLAFAAVYRKSLLFV